MAINLLKEVPNMCPFYDVAFPKDIRCTDVDLSQAGIDYYYRNDVETEGMFWKTARFEGDWIVVEFSCRDSSSRGVRFDVNGISIETAPNSPGEVDALIRELKFVKDVLKESEF